MRLLLAAALAAAAVIPATAPAAPRAPVATAAAAQRAVDGRHFSVTVRGAARTVIVCDLTPVVCRVARRHGARWEATLPDGPVPQGLVGSGLSLHQPTAIAGTGASFRVAVYALHRHGTTRRELRGRYLGA
jgi:hypothetical protein